jgi:hypothetical protein
MIYVDHEIETQIVPEVHVHFSRVWTAYILQLAETFGDKRHFAAAQRALLIGATQLRSSPVAEYPIVVSLIRDIEGAMPSFADYQSYVSGGKAMMTSLSRGH